MPEVKKFRITGVIKKGKSRIPFSVQFNAIREEDARQRLYSEMGSRHRARRFEIDIAEIREMKENDGDA